MAYTYAAPSGICYSDIGLALTFIVPANKCNLNCSFCVIKQRKEALQNTLSIPDYIHFTKSILEREQVAVIAVQGYEPLLPEAWPYTKAILELAASYGLPRSFISNGYLLKERVEEILELNPTGFSISIDSASEKLHDQMRGKDGAFAKAISGIKAFNRLSGDHDQKITVNSVLMPGRRSQLENIPELLADIGVHNWSVSPLVRIGKDEKGGPVAAGKQIIDDLLHLSDISRKHDVSVVLDDELRSIPKELVDIENLIVRRLERPDGLIRLNANGACSIGTDILKQVGEVTPIWNPSTMSPTAFLDSIRKASPDLSISAA